MEAAPDVKGMTNPGPKGGQGGDESLSLTYRDRFDADSLLQLNVHLNQLLLNGANQTQIDETIELFKNLFLTSSTNLGMTKKINNRNRNKNRNKTKSHRPGFDNECINKRLSFLKLKNRLKKNRTNAARDQLKIAGKEYRNFIRNKMKKYFKQFHKNLRKPDNKIRLKKFILKALKEKVVQSEKKTCIFSWKAK